MCVVGIRITSPVLHPTPQRHNSKGSTQHAPIHPSSSTNILTRATHSSDSTIITMASTTTTSSSTMTLTYFDFAGPAEPVRLALAMTGQPWEDKRISSQEFSTLKPGLPNGQVPVLEAHGKLLPQSGAQLRYVGKLAGLYPEDPLEAAFVDAAVDSVVDNHMKLVPTMFEKDQAKKMEMRQDLTSNFLPAWLGNLEKALSTAGGSYFAGGKLSIGDIAVVARLAWLKEGSLDGIPATIVDEYPLLSTLVERVNAEPKIAAYHQKRLENTTAK